MAVGGLNVNVEKGKSDGGAEPKKDRFNLDDILENEIGQFGKYQIITLLLAAFPIMFSAFARWSKMASGGRSFCIYTVCDRSSGSWSHSVGRPAVAYSHPSAVCSTALGRFLLLDSI
ncbi:hypothetical protein O0L34_g5726 [Tuta absoluta]|nr:hypothetical protein O0L34_g5726 [Tuta absoluta]